MTRLMTTRIDINIMSLKKGIKKPNNNYIPNWVLFDWLLLGMKLFSAAKSAVRVECVVAKPELLLLGDDCVTSLGCGNLSPYSSIFNASAKVVDVPKYKFKIN